MIPSYNKKAKLKTVRRQWLPGVELKAGGGMNRQAQRIFSAVKWLCDTVMMNTFITHLSKPIKCTTPRMNPNVSYILWVIWCVNIGSSVITCTSSGGGVDNRGGYACVGQGVYGKSVPSSQFCYEPRTALRKKPTTADKQKTKKHDHPYPEWYHGSWEGRGGG